MIRVLRWGQAEYERDPIGPLPPGVELLTWSLGDDAPIEAMDVVVVPSLRRVRAEHVLRMRPGTLVLTTTSGFDHVDVDAALARGVRCARLPLARRDAVVQSTLGTIFALTRRIAPMQDGARAGRWERAELPAHGATVAKTVAVFGAAGVIGRRMVEVLRAIGLDVLAVDPALTTTVGAREALAESDVVTLHCSMRDANERLIGAEAIAEMRPGAVLVNTARGRLVDVDAALRAVVSGHLGGLGLDVFPVEPAPLAAYAHPRVLLTPHAAGWHPGLGRAIAEGVSEAVTAYVAGFPVPFELNAADDRSLPRR